jgi:lupus La protein
MNDAVPKEQAEAATPAAPVVEAAIPEESSAPAPEAGAVVESSEEQPAAVTESNETEQEAQNGESKPQKTPRGPITNNRKFDPASQPVTDDPIKIRNQVEFYFNDSNLPTDKFMWEQTGGTENKPVPLKTICNFSRMRRFQPYSAVVAALKESTSLDVSGEEGEEVIKRKKAYVSSTDAQKKKVAKSVYIKGFGEEQASTQFDIEAWLSNYGTVNLVKLRRTDDNTFKGSIFVEFQTEELAKSFVALDPAPTWKDNELKIMMKRDYLDEKMRMIRAGEMEPTKNHKGSFFEGKAKGGKDKGHRGGGRGGGNRSGKDDSNDWKNKNGFQGRGGRRGRGGRGRGGRGGRGRGGRDNRDRREDKSEAAPRSSNKYVPPTSED